MAKHPLAEVFGFPTTDMSAKANRHRMKRLCPFNNKVPNCTKDKAQNPLGVCSVFHDEEVVITCPVRFRQEWIIADDAADFFFPAGATWTTLTEVRLKDAEGGSAGNIDVVLSKEVKQFLINMKVQSISKDEVLDLAANFSEPEDRQKVLRVVSDEFGRDYLSRIA